MKTFTCRLKAISVPQWVQEKYMLPARYQAAEIYRAVHREGAVFVKPEESPAHVPLALQHQFAHVNFSLPWVVEFGAGNGEFIINAARNHPQKLFIGVDVALPCIERALHYLAKLPALIPNVLFYHGFALDFLLADMRICLQTFGLHEVLVNFPDPWPKKRHHKRRLLSPAFCEAVTKYLVNDGVLITVTDVAKLYQYHLECLAARRELKRILFTEKLAAYNYYKFASHYEVKNLAQTEQFYYTAHGLRR